MSEAKEILNAVKEAAKAVATWAHATEDMVRAKEAHINALEEAAAQEEARVNYNAARNIDDDEEGCGLGSCSVPRDQSSIFAVRREAATALQAKRVAEALAAEAKIAAEAALKKAEALAKTT